MPTTNDPIENAINLALTKIIDMFWPIFAGALLALAVKAALQAFLKQQGFRSETANAIGVLAFIVVMMFVIPIWEKSISSH